MSARRLLVAALAVAFAAPALAAVPPHPHAAPLHAPTSHAGARNPAAPPSKPPPARIPSPIAIARVAVEVAPDRVVVTTDVTLPRGAWQQGDLDAFVSFGAPGLPSALDARLCPVQVGWFDARADEVCTPLAREPAPRAPTHAAFVVGRPQMAGEVVRIAGKALGKALAPSGLATLRIRELRPLPPGSASGAREVLARLGESRGQAYVLGAVEVSAVEGATLRKVDARLCGPNVEETTLAVQTAAPQPQGGTPPPLAPRATTDDLCVRLEL